MQTGTKKTPDRFQNYFCPAAVNDIVHHAYAWIVKEPNMQPKFLYCRAIDDPANDRGWNIIAEVWERDVLGGWGISSSTMHPEFEDTADGCFYRLPGNIRTVYRYPRSRLRRGLYDGRLDKPFEIPMNRIWIAMDDYSGPETKEGLRGMYHSPQDVSAFSDPFCGSVSVTPTRDEKQEPAKSGLEAKRDACAISAAHLDSPNTEIPDGKNMERE